MVEYCKLCMRYRQVVQRLVVFGVERMLKLEMTLVVYFHKVLSFVIELLVLVVTC